MVDLPGLLRRVLGDLRELGADHALVGGLAVSVRSEPRFTRDVDLAVAVDDDDAAERLVADLATRGWRVLETLEQDVVARLAAVRLADGSSTTGPVVDLLFASSGIEAGVVARADELEVLPDIRVKVARSADLVVLKLLAVSNDRPQDEQDLHTLVATLTASELRDAREAARDIEDRGFARGRDLLGALDERLGPQGQSR